jgi:hypothetical protein
MGTISLLMDIILEIEKKIERGNFILNKVNATKKNNHLMVVFVEG